MTSRESGTRPAAPVVSDQLAREIEKLVLSAKRSNRTLHTGVEARRLERLFPDAGMGHDDLCDEILALAIAARVPTQINSAI